MQYPSFYKICEAERATPQLRNWSANCAYADTLDTVDDVFTALFTLEMLLKILAQGFFIPSPTAYLRDPWNLLDCSIVIISLVDTFFFKYAPTTNGGGDDNGLAGLKALRAMRCLRPLRVISRNAGMKMVVNSLLRALPGVANVGLVMFGFMLIFGILGVQVHNTSYLPPLPSYLPPLPSDSADFPCMASYWRAVLHGQVLQLRHRKGRAQ